MGLNFIPKYPEISPCEPATTPGESIDDLFSQDRGVPGPGETFGWWILGLAICVLPWVLGIALISLL